MHKRSIITNCQFIYKKEGDHLRGKLKYFQYRDDKKSHIPQKDEQGERARQWVDRGLGADFSEIAAAATTLATTGLSKDVSARTLVIAPQMDMMQAIAEDRREAVLAELTEKSIEQWFEQANLPTPEYSYIIHQGEVSDSRPDGQIKDIQRSEAYYHAHVVLAATIAGSERERENYKIYTERRTPKNLDPNHVVISQLHEAGRENMQVIWERELGRERVQELNQALEQLTRDLEQRDIERATPDERSIAAAMEYIEQALGLGPAPELERTATEIEWEEAAEDPERDFPDFDRDF